MKTRLVLATALAALTLVAACNGGGKKNDGDDDDDDGTSPTPVTISATARVVHGPQVASSFAFGGVAPADGRWLLSPDFGRVTLNNISLGTSNGAIAIELEGCTPTYERDAPALSTILDCPFEIPEGTYTNVGVAVVSTFEVAVFDTLNGIYTDSSAGIVFNAPAAPEYYQYAVPGFGDPPTLNAATTYFEEPLVVAAGGTALQLTIVTDMLHTTFMNKTGGNAVIDESLAIPAVQLLPSFGAPGRIEFYSLSGTAANVLGGGPTDTDFRSIRLFYDAADNPMYIWFVGGAFPSGAWPADPATSPQFEGTSAGGYLGKDSNGNVCWAIPEDYTWDTYLKVCRFQPAANVGQTTTVECDNTSTAPAPISGSTYASGCPAITVDESFTTTLVGE